MASKQHIASAAPTGAYVPSSADPITQPRAAEGRFAFDPVHINWVALHGEDDPVADGMGSADAPAPERKFSDHHIPMDLARRYTFRPWRTEDVTLYRKLLDDPDLWRYMPEPFPDPLDTAQAAALIELANDAPNHLVRAVVHDGDILGQVRLSWSPELGTSRSPSVAEVSYWLGKAARGKGHGAAVVALFVAERFSECQAIERLFAKVHPQNIASQRLLDRIGFKRDANTANDRQSLVYWLQRADGLNWRALLLG